MKKDEFMREMDIFIREKLDFFAKVESDFDLYDPDNYEAILKCTDYYGLIWHLKFQTNSSSFEIKFNQDHEPNLENIYKELWEQAGKIIETSLLGVL